MYVGRAIIKLHICDLVGIPVDVHSGCHASQNSIQLQLGPVGQIQLTIVIGHRTHSIGKDLVVDLGSRHGHGSYGQTDFHRERIGLPLHGIAAVRDGDTLLLHVGEILTYLICTAPSIIDKAGPILKGISIKTITATSHTRGCKKIAVCIVGVPLPISMLGFGLGLFHGIVCPIVIPSKTIGRPIRRLKNHTRATLWHIIGFRRIAPVHALISCNAAGIGDPDGIGIFLHGKSQVTDFSISIGLVSIDNNFILHRLRMDQSINKVDGNIKVGFIIIVRYLSLLPSLRTSFLYQILQKPLLFFLCHACIHIGFNQKGSVSIVGSDLHTTLACKFFDEVGQHLRPHPETKGAYRNRVFSLRAGYVTPLLIFHCLFPNVTSRRNTVLQSQQQGNTAGLWFCNTDTACILRGAAQLPLPDKGIIGSIVQFFISSEEQVVKRVVRIGSRRVPGVDRPQLLIGHPVRRNHIVRVVV